MAPLQRASEAEDGRIMEPQVEAARLSGRRTELVATISDTTRSARSGGGLLNPEPHWKR